jgi:hypothetical protein
MPVTPRPRVVALTVVVALAVVQPALVGVPPADPGGRVGEVGGGAGLGGAVERHPSGAGATADALRTVRADAVHDRGLTGTGVVVGVVGQGFDADGAVASHVAGRRRIGDAPRSTAHDTAVAEIVAETAPDANLYLAGVGRTPTPAEYATAVEWLTARGADVIVDAGSYFPSVAADERRLTAAAERATDRGVVFVTSAGNYADRHWAGAGAANGWVAFADGDAANALADGERLRGRVTVRLRSRAAVDYDLYLYRRLPNAPDRVVAKSVGDGTGPELTVEAVDVAVPPGRYYVGIYADDVGSPGTPGSTPTPGRVQVFAAHHELEHTTARGSMVAPATSDRVVAVGAATDGARLSYSSVSAAGSADLTAPADAGTRAAPTLSGTSVAAPYVAGTAALVEAAGRDPSPARIEAILERTADGEGETVDALAAVEAATGPESAATGVPAPRSGDAAPEGGTVDGPTATADDARIGAVDRTTRTTTADRSTGNVTDPSGDDGTGERGTDRTDRPAERNRDDGSDRSAERDRSRNAGNTTDDAGSRDRRDGASDDEPRGR